MDLISLDNMSQVSLGSLLELDSMNENEDDNKKGRKYAVETPQMSSIKRKTDKQLGTKTADIIKID